MLFSPRGPHAGLPGFFLPSIATLVVGRVVPAPFRFAGLRLLGAIRQILIPGPHPPDLIALCLYASV